MEQEIDVIFEVVFAEKQLRDSNDKLGKEIIRRLAVSDNFFDITIVCSMVGATGGLGSSIDASLTAEQIKEKVKEEIELHLKPLRASAIILKLREEAEIYGKDN